MVRLCPSAHYRDPRGRMPRYGFALEHRLSRCPIGGFPEAGAGQPGKKQQILQVFSLAFHPSVAPLDMQDASLLGNCHDNPEAYLALLAPA